jgi:hypothetical protein
VTVVMTPDEARRVVDTVKDGGGAADEDPRPPSS